MTPAERERKVRRKERNLTFLLDYLKAHPCVDCGESDPIVLDFDHVRGKKILHLSYMAGQAYGLETIKAEIAKCEVRCANCHKRQTAIRAKHFRARMTGAC